MPVPDQNVGAIDWGRILGKVDWAKLIQQLLDKNKPKPPAPKPPPVVPPPPPPPHPVPPPPPVPTPTPGGDADRLLYLHNQARNGSALRIESRLTAAAQKHSEWMRANNRMSHDQNGRPFTDRIKAEGYPHGYAGENIANGYRTADSVFQGWMNSPGHRQNILNTNFREVGFGRAGNYWTAVFATPRFGFAATQEYVYLSGVLQGDEGDE